MEIQQVKTPSNISYSEAVRKVQGQRERDESNGRERQQGARGEESQTTQNKIEQLTAEQIIVFIALCNQLHGSGQTKNRKN